MHMNFKSNTMEKYHIGQEILKEVEAKYPTVVAFAKDLCKSSSATYEIFGKTSLDTDLLLKVSKLLDRDFFQEFSEKCLNGELAVEDKNSGACISSLLPEDELHVITPYGLEGILEEYFLAKRKKPLVIFYGDRSLPIHQYIQSVGEEIHGKGMVKDIFLNKKDFSNLETQVPSLTQLPQKVMLLRYGSGMYDNGFDDLVLFAEKLLANSDKFVIITCNYSNSLGNGRYGRLEYKSDADSAFNTWHERIHAFVADNENKDFTYTKELYQAAINKGYIDNICNLLKRDDDEDKKEAKQMIEEAKQKLGTFQDTIIEEDANHIRHKISTIQLRPGDKTKLPDCFNTPKTEMWYDEDKETHKITDWEYNERDWLTKQILKMED